MKRFLLFLSFFACAVACLGEVPTGSAEELYEGKEYSKAFANPVDDPDLPNVLLIGDSISIGYTVDVRKQLHGKADVFRIPENGKYTDYGLENIDKWLGKRKWDVIHFNWGLWDICYRNPESKTQGNRDKKAGTLTTTPEAYGKNLEAILVKLKQTGASLIWCATTPVPEFELGRNVGDEVKYNEIAAEIMGRHEVSTDDLYAHALGKLPEIKIANGDVHFTKEGYRYLAEEVSRVISLKLKEQK